MKTHVRCGTLFSAGDREARSEQTLVYDARGVLEFVGPTKQAPKAAPGEPLLDYSRQFVMPGLIDVHVHLAYGNAKSEEDIDLYSPLEFRALRGLFFAQKLLAAGYTALCLAGRRRAGQPVDSQRDPRRSVRRAAHHRRRALHHGTSEPDRLVSELDRRSVHLDRPAGHQSRRSDRGDPRPGQERRRLCQDRARRHPAPSRRIPDCRVHRGRDRRHGARDPAARPQGGGPRDRPRGRALCRARRRRSDLPCLRPRR